MVLSSVMLTACATSGDSSRPVEPDPVIETKTTIIKLCPEELRLAIPEGPTRPAASVIKTSDAMLKYLAARFAREDLLESRLRDAAGACPDG
jgi:hypothetical protein